jgi:NAD kinase
VGRPRKQAIAFISSGTAEAFAAQERLGARYGAASPEKAEVIVALGGDGFMLQTLHAFMNSGKPIYGMNCGSVGFLMNEFIEESLRERIANAVVTAVHPLAMRARDQAGKSLTPISAFRPRLWRGALLPDRAKVSIEALEEDKRPINVVADHTEFKSVIEVTVAQDRRAQSLIMFDPDHSWDERILSEQFRY